MLAPASEAPSETVPTPSEAEVDLADAQLDAWSAVRTASLRTAGEGLRVIIDSSVRPIDRVSPLAATSDAGDAAISLDLAPPVDIGTAVHRVMELITSPPATTSPRSPPPSAPKRASAP